MKKLWIFGDSFSCDWSNTVTPGHTEYAKKYNPEHFKTVISSELNLEVVNMAVSGYCNQSILESVGSSINSIGKDDYVVIGWSEITRWRNTSILGGNWTIVGVNFTTPWKKNINPLYRYESVNRDCKPVAKEFNSWVNILKKALPINTFHWTPFQAQKTIWNLDVEEPPFGLQRIKEKTGILDRHMTSESHIDVGKWITKRFKQEKYDKPLL